MKAIVMILAAALLAACSGNDKLPGGSGLIEATEITVSAETTGRIKQLFCDEGDAIADGAEIALIDTTEVVLRIEQSQALLQGSETKADAASIQVEQASSKLDLTQKDFARIDNLLKTGSANQQQFDRAKNDFDQAKLAEKSAGASLRAARADVARIKAELALLEDQLDKCRPKAPSSGTVVTRYVEAGELAAPGKPLVKIARLDSVWVKIYLPPQDLTAIKLGDRAEVDPEDGREAPLPGTITWISPEAEFTPKNVQTKESRADLVYAVKITIPNFDQTLKIGMPVAVRIP